MAPVWKAARRQSDAAFMHQQIVAPLVTRHLGHVQHGRRQIRPLGPEPFVVKANLGRRHAHFIRQEVGKCLCHRRNGRDGGVVLHSDRARTARAAPRLDPVAVALHHVDHVSGDAGLVGKELGIDRLVPLPVGLRAHIDVHATLGRILHLGRFGRIAQNALDVIAQAQPPQQALVRIRRLAGGKASEVRLDLGPAQDLVKVAHVIGLARGGGIWELVRLDKVDAAQFQRINAQLARGAVHGAFEDIDRLGSARPAIGVHLRGVGVIADGAQIGRLHIVNPHQNPAKERRLDRLGELRVIGPHIGLGQDAVTDDLVILVKGQFGQRGQIAARIVAQHRLGPL
mmetsp:Transcript_100/g.284  ORF Transcript_100/g.284 Transcript_100/m.284 type:complete len:341 (+) Transcript_100:3067-4089(+)